MKGKTKVDPSDMEQGHQGKKVNNTLVTDASEVELGHYETNGQVPVTDVSQNQINTLSANHFSSKD